MGESVRFTKPRNYAERKPQIANIYKSLSDEKTRTKHTISASEHRSANTIGHLKNQKTHKDNKKSIKTTKNALNMQQTKMRKRTGTPTPQGGSFTKRAIINRLTICNM